MRPKVPPLPANMAPFERPPTWWRAQHALVGRSKLLQVEWLAKTGLLTDPERALLERRARGEKVPELCPVDHQGDGTALDLAPGRAALLLKWPKEHP